MPFKSCGPGIEFQMFETYLCDSISNKNIYLGPMTFRLLQSCEIPPHWYEGARILVIMRACRPRISRPHCSTAAPSPVLLQSPQISCSALSSVWHIWYLANSAVILQWIDSVPSAQCPVCDAVQCFETFSKTFLAALAGRRGGRGAAADRQ